jgi:hypothetical protein
MNSVNKFAKSVGMVALGVTLCLGTANAAPRASQRKASKKAETTEPPLPAGPTGRPVPQIPLDSMAPVPPQVSYQNGQLTIVAHNSTLGEILRAVRKQTGADIDIPSATDRVVTNLGPGPAQDVMAELLNGSRFNYVLLGSPQNAAILTRVVLVPKAAPEKADKAVANNQAAAGPQPAMAQAMNAPPQDATDTSDADANDDPNANANMMDQNPDQSPAEPDQYGTPTDQPQAKTPQQMLQEMQQRQLQFQQQMQQQQGDPAAQPPVYTPGLPQRPQPQ